MNYSSELKKFLTSQYIYSGARIALAIVIPSIILAQFGLLKEYFLFPLGTSFVGLTDQPGPFIRRRNTLLLSIFSFFLIALFASIIKDFPIAVYLEIVLCGFFFSMIGVYGLRLATFGSLALVVLSIFIDGHLTGDDIFRSSFIFFLGCFWFFIVFMVVSTLQPYKLASQVVGENYLELADYLRIKAKYYTKDPDFDSLLNQLISQQIKIKNHQEDTREIVFKTRKIVNESTTQSRILMLMFLNSVDLYDKLLTSENDYKRMNQVFGDTKLIQNIHYYLMLMADEITNLGISLQSGLSYKQITNFDEELKKIYDEFFEHRSQRFSSETLEDFMMLRQVLMRITEITDEVNTILKVNSQDVKLAKSLSTGLDYSKFLPKEEQLNHKVFLSNFSLKSGHFRHAIRVTIALLLGYIVSRFEILGIGHSYWILITIIAILKPAYSTTKHRNLLRFFGTLAGAIIAYIILYFVGEPSILLAILLVSMIICFSLLKSNYFWAVLFMTIYIFLSFNFLRPGNVNLIFKDRLLDTLIGGVITFLVAYFILPVWEHTQNLDLMKKSSKSNLEYFRLVMDHFLKHELDDQDFRLKRKNAIIDLANLSDNFQRMISDPKNQQRKLETVHQFVTTTHLITAYTASLSQYAKTGHDFPEIDFENWKIKISAELLRTSSLLFQKDLDEKTRAESHIKPEDHVTDLLEKRKAELESQAISNERKPFTVSHLTEIKNIKELLELINDVAKDQRKIIEEYLIYQSTIAKQ
ncbi:putative membrane protein YccC [Epilithonimonas hungarica]|uniref:FUSC family protein n=1 Tax=Epilithonimonas hungarica TaxID=454006 RepID=UPI0027889A82|nr:FUSC family membrane protein [Epilithonimonas hungarica]MDP9956405.1 putative membrane protein YccC [Epilithonimonas hungarica]